MGHLLFTILICLSASLAYGQDKYSRYFSTRILAPKIPSMHKGVVESKLKSVTFNDLNNFALVRVKSTISASESFDSLSIGPVSTEGELRFLPHSRKTVFKPGDWLRIMSITREDPIAELEQAGKRNWNISGFSDAYTYTMIALKMSPDFKKAEMYLLNALAAPGTEIKELEVFKSDVLSNASELYLDQAKAGDVIIGAVDMPFGNHKKILAANTPLVIESVTSQRQPWRFVWKYSLNLRIIDCPEEFNIDRCRGTYSEEFMRKPLLFFGKINGVK